MGTKEQYRELERELTEAYSSTLAEDDSHPPTGCPTPADLRQFEAGKYGHNQDQRYELMAHLGTCDQCVRFIMRLKRRRVWIRRAGLVLAPAVVLIAVWIGLQRPTVIPDRVATIDLRLSSPTRGIEKANDEATFKVHRDVGRLRLILPPGSEGSYQFELLGYQQVIPAVRGSGQTTVEREKVILNLTASLARLTPGKYSLALRHNDSDWEYYSLIVE